MHTTTENWILWIQEFAVGRGRFPSWRKSRDCLKTWYVALYSSKLDRHLLLGKLRKIQNEEAKWEISFFLRESCLIKKYQLLNLRKSSSRDDGSHLFSVSTVQSLGYVSPASYTTMNSRLKSQSFEYHYVGTLYSEPLLGTGTRPIHCGWSVDSLWLILLGIWVWFLNSRHGWSNLSQTNSSRTSMEKRWVKTHHEFHQKGYHMETLHHRYLDPVMANTLIVEKIILAWKNAKMRLYRAEELLSVLELETIKMWIVTTWQSSARNKSKYIDKSRKNKTKESNKPKSITEIISSFHGSLTMVNEPRGLENRWRRAMKFNDRRRRSHLKWKCLFTSIWDWSSWYKVD